MKSVPYFDLKEQTRRIRLSLDRVWRSTLASSGFILGKPVADFEEAFAQYVGCRFAAGVSTGLDALTLTLVSLGIGRGDEVIVPANSFIATALAVSQTGARAVFADVSPDTLLLDPSSARRALTRKTRAIIPVHLFGQPVDLSPFFRLGRGHRLWIVEDAAQAHGASFGGAKCGSQGKAGCFSFYPGKNLGAFGDGGMITTNDSRLYRRVLHLRNYGSTQKYIHPVKGYNMRLDALQAGILRVKLLHLDHWNRNRRRLAAEYDRRLPGSAGIWKIPVRPDAECIYHLYPICFDERDALKRHLEAQGVGTQIHYPIPIHLQKAYKDLGYRRGALPVSEKACRQILSLPLYPEMSMGDVRRVCRAIKLFIDNKVS